MLSIPVSLVQLLIFNFLKIILCIKKSVIPIVFLRNTEIKVSSGHTTAEVCKFDKTFVVPTSASFSVLKKQRTIP